MITETIETLSASLAEVSKTLMIGEHAGTEDIAVLECTYSAMLRKYVFGVRYIADNRYTRGAALTINQVNHAAYDLALTMGALYEVPAYCLTWLRNEYATAILNACYAERVISTDLHQGLADTLSLTYMLACQAFRLNDQNDRVGN